MRTEKNSEGLRIAEQERQRALEFEFFALGEVAVLAILRSRRLQEYHSGEFQECGTQF